MRFGMIAAAAAALVCAGQADAARYYEFEIKGQTLQTFIASDVLPYNYLILSDIKISFDSLAIPGGLRFGAPGSSVIVSNGNFRTDTVYDTANTFSINYDPAKVPISETLRPFDVTGYIGSVLCIRTHCGIERIGQIYWSTARTSDIAPAQLGVFESSTQIILPVPEPTTWAMMILGMAAVGFTLRRRTKNVTTTVAYAA